MSRFRTFTVALAVAALALTGVALGQNADPNSAAPTKNDYRLRVVEPAEGATISGSSFQVVVDLRPHAEVGSERKNSDSMPRPRVDVFLDNENKGTLQEGQNVVTIDGVTAGSHKLVVLAKNLSGEVIDRKEINVTAEPRVAVAQSSAETYRAPASAPAPAPGAAHGARARAPGAECPSSERSPARADDLDAPGDDDGSDGDAAGNRELRSSLRGRRTRSPAHRTGAAPACVSP